MNSPRRNRRFTRFPVVLVALLAILGSLAPTASAQTNPGAVLATQFFGSITGEEAGYLTSSDAVLYTPEGDYVGRAGLGTFGDDLAASFAHLEFSIESAAQAGELVIVSLTITGVNTGSYHGIAANCAGITVPAVAMLRVSDQVVVSEAWKSLPVELRYHVPQMEQVTMVTEQRIDYDRDLITSQISAVNLLDPGDRPGCAAKHEPVAPVAPYVPPACTNAETCELPMW
jgi:hypothetical protein